LAGTYQAVAARYDKLAANYLAFVKVACIRLWLRSYEFTALNLRCPLLGKFCRQFQILDVPIQLTKLLVKLNVTTRNRQSVLFRQATYTNGHDD